MLDDEQREQILRQTLTRSIATLVLASEALQKGLEPKTQLARMRRALRAIKTDARTLDRTALAELAGHLERAAEATHVHGEPEFPTSLLEETIRIFRARAESAAVPVDKDLMVAAQRVGDAARERLREGGLRRA